MHTFFAYICMQLFWPFVKIYWRFITVIDLFFHYLS